MQRDWESGVQRDWESGDVETLGDKRGYEIVCVEAGESEG